MNKTLRQKIVLGTLAIVMGSAAALVAIDAAMDPLKVGGDMYKLVFENDRTRVMQVTFKPGGKIAMHSHPDHFAYALNDGSLKITGADGKTSDANAKAGQLFWMDAQSHSAENAGKSEFKLLVVEYKEPRPMTQTEPAITPPAATTPAKTEPAKKK